jgi:ppGpp synthetase/RelA/SpoT-type nucleotidyltranferase
VLPSTKVLDDLGEAIRTDTMTPTDWALFRELRQQWRSSLDSLKSELDQMNNLQYFTITGRLKNTSTIREKLSRSTLRLSNIRDIIGCRVVVPDNIAVQDAVVRDIAMLIQSDRHKIIDRRVNSNNGYRAVHLELRRDEMICEIQVRTQLQDLWATTSEAFGEKVGRGFRYGDQIQLADFSPHSRKLITQITAGLSEASKQIGANEEIQQDEIAEIEQSLAIINSSIYEITKGVS